MLLQNCSCHGFFQSEEWPWTKARKEQNMARSRNALPATWTIGDLLKHFGGISPRRIRLRPAPGTATEQDVIDIQNREDRLYELVDGVLVEKIMGFPESYLAAEIVRLAGSHVAKSDLGIVVGADGTVRLMPDLVRIPDVSFVSWRRLPARKVPPEPIPDLAPNLAVEVLSRGNTKREMDRKLKDYFLAGVELVWFIDPAKRTVRVYTAPDESILLTEEQTLDGGQVLPGFRLPLKELFAKMSLLNSGQPKERKRPRK
jgi:Uma2 family endonuclease